MRTVAGDIIKKNPSVITAILALTLSACQASNEKSSTLAQMMDESSTPSIASGNFQEDSRIFRTLFHRVAFSMGAEAGYYEGCIGADTTMMKQNLATYSVMNEVPKNEIMNVERSYDNGKKEGKRGGCGRVGKSELLRSNNESADKKLRFFSCTMLWYHSGSWERKGDGLSRAYKGDFFQYVQGCDSNIKKG